MEIKATSNDSPLKPTPSSHTSYIYHTYRHKIHIEYKNRTYVCVCSQKRIVHVRYILYTKNNYRKVEVK